jgi:uncharacterized protein YkwD
VRSATCNIVALLAACAWSAAVAQAPLPTSLPLLPAHFLEGRLLELTNAERMRAGVPPVVPSPTLGQAARHHAEEMARLAYFSHVSPTPGRHSVGDRVAAVGGAAVVVGENLSASSSGGLDLSERVIAGWMQSPGHRQNLLEPWWTHVGFGLHEGHGGRTYVAQVFAADPNPIVSAYAAWDAASSIAVRFEIATSATGWVVVSSVDARALPLELAAGTTGVFVLDRLNAAASTHLRVGWTTDRAAGFIGQESGWFDPGSGLWSADWRSDLAVTRVLRTATREPVRDVALALTFERAASALVVTVDDVYVPAEVVGSSLLFTVPGRDGVRRVEVGERQADDRVRILHRVDLVVQGREVSLRGGR